jgi:hypothetical protein
MDNGFFELNFKLRPSFELNNLEKNLNAFYKNIKETKSRNKKKNLLDIYE